MSYEISKIFAEGFIAVDTETTGFNWHKEDYAFGIGIYNEQGKAYFDERKSGLAEVIKLLNNFKGFIFMHNAKFDLHFLTKAGFQLQFYHLSWCTAAMHRLVNNTLPSYKLEDLGARLGYEKDRAVEEWITKNKAYTMVSTPGKKKRSRDKHFEQVPLEIIEKYCIKDAEICFRLGMYQYDLMKEYNIAKNEMALTPVLFRMEKRGILLDEKYTRECLHTQRKVIAAAELEFNRLTGEKFVDSGKALSGVFDKLGIGYPTTEKGNPSFTASALASVKHPIQEIIIKQRQAYKKGFTYFANYLEMRDGESVIHGEFNQGGTATGRMSAKNPNLQNVPKEESGTALVRRCFIARPEFRIVSIDMDQFEYRMALNYSNEQGLIQQVNNGLDIHTATANLMNVPRTVAKTINFLLLYGGGPGKLAEALGCTRKEAVIYFEKYHSNIPKMKEYINKTMGEAYTKGYIVNPFGRKCKIEQGFEYKAVNYQIQGGTADWIKIALVQCDKYLKHCKSSIITQVHDEINFEVHESEMKIIKDMKYIMENVAKTPHVPYTAGVKIGNNLQELEEWAC